MKCSFLLNREEVCCSHLSALVCQRWQEALCPRRCEPPAPALPGPSNLLSVSDSPAGAERLGKDLIISALLLAGSVAALLFLAPASEALFPAT